MNSAPTIHTHVAATADLPEEPKETDIDRPDIEVPSLWRRSVVAIHRHTKRRVIVHKVAHDTCQWRPFYPDEIDPKTGSLGRFASRTEWLSFDPKGLAGDWEPEVTLSPEELERQSVRYELEAAISKLDIREAALVNALCDDVEPAKNFAKLKMLIVAGLIKGGSLERPEPVMHEPPAEKVDRRTRAYRESKGEP